jgi:3-oxoacyl-[acyl-carrier protein] reductase
MDAAPGLHGAAPVAVITGAAQGLGRVFAQSLAAAGHRVVVADLDGDRAAGVADEIGSAALAVQVDVADAVSVEAMRERVVDELVRCDVLINNAAVFSTLQMRPFDEIPLDEWDRVLSVNVTGAFLCCRAFAPVLRRQGSGTIINISSATVHEGRPHYAHYVTSKAALIGLTRALARELGEHGITVNAVAPGPTETEVPRATVTQAQVPAILARQSLKRRERPEDVAGVVAFLAGPGSNFMTGQTLLVDGGATFR